MISTEWRESPTMIVIEGKSRYKDLPYDVQISELCVKKELLFVLLCKFWRGMIGMQGSTSYHDYSDLQLYISKLTRVIQFIGI